MRLTPFAIASLAIVLAACGPSKARPDPAAGGGGGDGGGTGSAVEHTANPSTCAATYGELHAGASCQGDATCSYPEGRCWCGPSSYCGGVPPTEEVLASLARPTWQCKPVRTDGCPEAEPSGACDRDGQVCSYGDCCFEQYTCQAGTWARTGGGCPP